MQRKSVFPTPDDFAEREAMFPSREGTYKSYTLIGIRKVSFRCGIWK